MVTNLTEQLRRDEGEVLHAYQDHLGYWTMGVGRLIDKRKGGGITAAESAYLLGNDITAKTSGLVASIPWVEQLDPVRRAVLQNMAFQMGVEGLLGFKNTLNFIKNGNYAQAALNMQMSKWHSQTPERSDRLIKQMITGEWQ
jgi:lysozyme